MAKTRIEWTDVTVNSFPGCRKISPGCDNCYAETMAKRLKAMGVPAYQDVVDERGWTGKVGCNLAAMRVPGKGKRVFCQSMGDLFYGGITDDQRDQVFGEMLAQPGHTFQVLTKRPQRALAYYEGVAESQVECGEPNPLAYAENIWFGWTAEDQPRLDERTPFGLLIPAVVRFVSLEPLLGPINFTVKCPPAFRPILRSDQIDWVIVGCESGPNRRPCRREWMLDLYDQCESAGVAMFFKQAEIDGKVVTDAERIAAWMGKRVEDIRQFPKVRQA